MGKLLRFIIRNIEVLFYIAGLVIIGRDETVEFTVVVSVIVVLVWAFFRWLERRGRGELI